MRYKCRCRLPVKGIPHMLGNSCCREAALHSYTEVTLALQVRSKTGLGPKK